MILQTLGQPIDALSAYDRAISLDRFNADTWDSKGQLLRELGRHKEADETEAEARRLKG